MTRALSLHRPGGDAVDHGEIRVIAGTRVVTVKTRLFAAGRSAEVPGRGPQFAGTQTRFPDRQRQRADLPPQFGSARVRSEVGRSEACALSVLRTGVSQLLRGHLLAGMRVQARCVAETARVNLVRASRVRSRDSGSSGLLKHRPGGDTCDRANTAEKSRPRPEGSELTTRDVVKETDVASRKLTALPRQREFLNGKPKFLRAKLSLAN